MHHPVLVSARDANTLATTPYNNPQLLRCVQQQVQLGYNHNCAVNCFFAADLLLACPMMKLLYDFVTRSLAFDAAFRLQNLVQKLHM